MTVRVKLDDIIEGLEAQSNESYAFLDKRTGKVLVISDYEMRAAEDDEPLDDFPEWEQDLVATAKEIAAETGDYIQLPDKFDIHEYSIMERFCLSLQDAKMCDTLYGLIKGSGAFRRFKGAIHDYGIADDWYKYRDNALPEIAIEWCDENNIQFIDK
jgi:hypothetical protein